MSIASAAFIWPHSALGSEPLSQSATLARPIRAKNANKCPNERCDQLGSGSRAVQRYAHCGRVFPNHGLGRVQQTTCHL
jgi:hypothetical protein